MWDCYLPKERVTEKRHTILIDKIFIIVFSTAIHSTSFIFVTAEMCNIKLLSVQSCLCYYNNNLLKACSFILSFLSSFLYFFCCVNTLDNQLPLYLIFSIHNFYNLFFQFYFKDHLNQQQLTISSLLVRFCIRSCTRC